MVADNHCITIEKVNPNLRKLNYVLLGPLDIRAKEIERDLSKGCKKPFKSLLSACLGDAQAMGQKPMTYIRQTLALVTLPELFDESDFPNDVKMRAMQILNECRNHSVGSYTHSYGLEIVRKHIAEFIERRDGFPSNWQNVIITSGATESIRVILKLFACEEDGKKSGVLVPVPQYPLYASALVDFGMAQNSYYLDEDSNWELNISELKRTVDHARTYCNPRVLVVINPGNPTGQVLSKKNIKEIIKFAYDEELFILADEVYQLNVYGEGAEFFSFKKVLMEMGTPYCNMELASVMSGSKGYMGECGIRGGYMELINMHPEIWNTIYKTIQATLCPNIYGQILMDCVAKPPQKGEPSYEEYLKEKKAIMHSFERRAYLITNILNSFKGFKCNPIQGAMYAFPQIQLPPRAIEAAEKAGQSPDLFYAFQLLEKYGVCIIPGSGFGQKQGTYHFRMTILPQIDMIREIMQKIFNFHTEFMAEYS